MIIRTSVFVRQSCTLCTAQVYDGQLEARLTQLVRSGVAVTINSDDAAYFGAYVNENYEWIAKVGRICCVHIFICAHPENQGAKNTMKEGLGILSRGFKSIVQRKEFLNRTHCVDMHAPDRTLCDESGE